MSALTVAGLVKRYGDRLALDGVDLAVESGQVLALLGPNGAGKTTLARIVAGVLAPDAGTVRVTGRPGFAPQEIGVYPSLTVLENLCCFGELHGLGAREARARAGELLEPFGLGELAGRPAGGLSGGEQRRLHTAIALVSDPRVVLLDEPTAGADQATRAGILEAVGALAARGTAVLYTTHYLPEVESLRADVALLEEGRLIATGALDDVVARHAAPVLVLSFAGAPPAGLRELPGAIAGDGHVRLPCADPATVLRDALAGLGDEVARLDRVEIVRPSLEAAYLALTGRRDAEP